MKRLFLVFLFLSTFASPSVAQLAGEPTGNGLRSMGTAGASMTGVSVLDTAHNPAALPFAMGNDKGRLEGVVRVLYNNTKVSSVDGQSMGIDDTLTVGPWLALGMQLDPNTWASLALVPTSGAKGEFDRWTELNVHNYDPGDPLIPTDYVHFSTDLQQVGIDPTLSIRVNPSFSWGLGLSIRQTMMDLQGASEADIMDLRGEDPTGLFDSWGHMLSSFGIDDHQVTYDVEGENEHPHVFLKLGAMLQASPDLRMGFWYRPPSTASDMSGSAFVDMRADLGAFNDAAGVITLENELTSQFDLRIADVRLPQQAGTSWMYKQSNGDLWSFAAIWTQWSAAFDGWSAYLDNPSNDEMGLFMGDPAYTEMDMDLRWRDTLALSLGWETQVDEFLSARTGLGWSRNPISGSWLPSATPFNQWHLGGGLTYAPVVKSMPEIQVALVLVPPQKAEAGENVVLSDFSKDRFEQWHASLAFGATWRW